MKDKTYTYFEPFITLPGYNDINIVITHDNVSSNWAHLYPIFSDLMCQEDIVLY